jgi:hypothetical protein
MLRPFYIEPREVRLTTTDGQVLVLELGWSN